MLAQPYYKFTRIILVLVLVYRSLYVFMVMQIKLVVSATNYDIKNLLFFQKHKRVYFLQVATLLNLHAYVVILWFAFKLQVARFVYKLGIKSLKDFKADKGPHQENISTFREAVSTVPRRSLHCTTLLY